MSVPKPKDDPVKMHKEAKNLMEQGKYSEARELFLTTADLYFKKQNYFDSATMYYNAGECGFALKEYEKALENFTKSSEISFSKGFDRYGLSALDYAKDCQKALGHTKEVEELEKKMKEVKAKLESAF
jgi:tetratricopeptide (TPR) repeat protein